MDILCLQTALDAANRHICFVPGSCAGFEHVSLNRGREVKCFILRMVLTCSVLPTKLKLINCMVRPQTIISRCSRKVLGSDYINDRSGAAVLGQIAAYFAGDMPREIYQRR